MRKTAFILPLASLCLSCSHKTAEPVSDDGIIATQPAVVIGINKDARPSKARPQATAFRMTGDYSDNVAVTLDREGNLSYFPDPSDISENSRPVSLGGGWWLNRQGISENSVFTRYSFREYAELPHVPSPDELKAAIIPGAHVEKMVALPYPASKAMSHLSEIKVFLKDEE